ncbi:MAG: hypothetical protein ABI439_04075 [Rhodospirillales bacterium]
MSNVGPDALELVNEVWTTCDLTLGKLLSADIRDWYDRPPEIDDVDDSTSAYSSDDIVVRGPALGPT